MGTIRDKIFTDGDIANMAIGVIVGMVATEWYSAAATIDSWSAYMDLVRQNVFSETYAQQIKTCFDVGKYVVPAAAAVGWGIGKLAKLRKKAY